jgi:hypothetical protein
MALAMLLFCCTLPLAAQKKDNKESASTRSVQGVVQDGSENAIEGAVVQLKDTKSLQIRSFITKSDGTYHFHGLSRDIDYEIKADHAGKSSDSRRLSTFDSRNQAVLNLKIQ